MVAFAESPDEQEEAEHVAAMVRADRCVSISGRTTLHQLPIAYGLSEGVTTYTNNLCMQRISMDEVFETVCRTYSSRHS
jgi:hypothetical protein